jgi:hypothetical protein
MPRRSPNADSNARGHQGASEILRDVNERAAMDNVNPNLKPIRVYLESVIVSGMLPTRHQRLSDYFNLAAGHECFALKDSSAEDFEGHPFAANPGEFLIYKPQVILVADMREAEKAGSSEMNLERIDKEGRKFMLSVGPFWLRGTIHILPGTTPQQILTGNTGFVPLTEARVLKPVQSELRTFLINQTKIGVMASLD